MSANASLSRQFRPLLIVFVLSGPHPMARIGLEGGPPRFNFAASLAALAALCFIVQGLAGFTAQWIQRPTFGSWGKPNCPTVEQVTAAANPWAFDAMLDVDEVTGLCTSAGSGQRPTECPNPLTGCMGADGPFPCCVFDPNTTSWFASWTRLDRQTTQEQWRKRRDADPFLVTSFAAGSLGWIATVPGVTCLAACLGSAHRSVAGAMPAAIKAAAILSLVEFTSQIGAAQTSAWISDWPALAVKETHPDSAAEGAVQAPEIKIGGSLGIPRYTARTLTTQFRDAGRRSRSPTCSQPARHCGSTRPTGCSSPARCSPPPSPPSPRRRTSRRWPRPATRRWESSSRCSASSASSSMCAYG